MWCKQSNAEVLEILEMKKELMILKKKKKYFGHMNRHTTLLKNVLEGINLWEASERYKWEDNQEVDEQKSIGVHN